MREVFNRLVKQRYNLKLFTSILKSSNEGRMSKDSLLIVEKWSYLLYISFIIKWLGRIYLDYKVSDLMIFDFIKKDILSIILWFLIYGLFLDTLLGIGYHDNILKTKSKKYVKTLLFLIVYLIGNFVSLSYYISYLYDYFLVSFLCLVSSIIITLAYIVIFMCVLDFILYYTDNSDDPQNLNSQKFDFL